MTESREKKRALQARIAALQKSSPRAGKIKEFQHELESLVKDTRGQEAEIGDFKRFALREAFYLRFNAMAEYAEKTALLAGFGKVKRPFHDDQCQKKLEAEPKSFLSRYNAVYRGFN